MVTKEKGYPEVLRVLIKTVGESKGLLSNLGLSEIDSLFGDILEKLNDFFKAVEERLKDFVAFEQYVTCAHTSQIGYSLAEMPKEVRDKVWELRNHPEVCPFADGDCVCGKSTEYLKKRFLEKINFLTESGNLVKIGSQELEAGLEDLGKDVEKLTASAQRIMTIAELIEIIALNAYIEAARLGEEGRGFKVIADEVRRASVRTNELASEIIESIKRLQKSFSDQIEKQRAFSTRVSELEKDQAEFSKVLNRDLLWMAQNFVDFMDYVRKAAEDDVKVLRSVRETILGAIGKLDLVGHKAQKTEKALRIVADMLDALEDLLEEKRSLEEAKNLVSSLYQEFRRVVEEENQT